MDGDKEKRLAEIAEIMRIHQECQIPAIIQEDEEHIFDTVRIFTDNNDGNKGNRQFRQKEVGDIVYKSYKKIAEYMYIIESGNIDLERLVCKNIITSHRAAELLNKTKKDDIKKKNNGHIYTEEERTKEINDYKKSANAKDIIDSIYKIDKFGKLEGCFKEYEKTEEYKRYEEYEKTEEYNNYKKIEKGIKSDGFKEYMKSGNYKDTDELEKYKEYEEIEKSEKFKEYLNINDLNKKYKSTITIINDGDEESLKAIFVKKDNEAYFSFEEISNKEVFITKYPYTNTNEKGESVTLRLTRDWEKDNRLETLIDIVNDVYAGDIEIISKENNDIEIKPLSDEIKEKLSNDNESKPDEKITELHFKSGIKLDKPRNRIIFGAPGTGKSYKIKEDIEALEKEYTIDYERVTFHPDYSYANFVGTYKPVPIKNEGKKEGEKEGKKEDSITYKYVPGPFMRVYKNALKDACERNDKKIHLLIIEEINRANVAAVFGDVFQLLDRDEEGVSEYPIEASEDIKKYLAQEPDGKDGDPEKYSKIYIPDNMFIWATMNSADQGVFPMDTAFKRRWNFEYLGIDNEEEKIEGKRVKVGKDGKQEIEWNSLRKAINEFLADKNINEDKQIGPFFIPKSILSIDEKDKDNKEIEDTKKDKDKENNVEIDSKKFCDVFKNKVIMYLFEDVDRQKRLDLFEEVGKDKKRYSKICDAFDEQGIYIFNKVIKNHYDDYLKKYEDKVKIKKPEENSED